MTQLTRKGNISICIRHANGEKINNLCYVSTEEMHCGGATETAWYWSKWFGPFICCKITVSSAVDYPASHLFVLLLAGPYWCIFVSQVDHDGAPV